jgi:hypothetical protein
MSVVSQFQTSMRAVVTSGLPSTADIINPSHDFRWVPTGDISEMKEAAN